jgi:hypothetical protein
VDPDAAAGLPDAGPDLQEFEPQGVDLGGGHFHTLEVVPQQPEQAVGRGVEEQPELVGQEAMATQAVGLEFQLQLLDAVFHVAPEHLKVVINELWITAQIGDHEPLVGAQTGIFHLGDDPAGLVPGLHLVAKGRKEPLFLSGFQVLGLGL